MKIKNTIKTTICCALLLNLIALSAPQIISANIASASVGAANFLPNYFWAGIDTINETTISLGTAQAITSMLANYNSPYGCYYSYEDSCTYDSYCNILLTLKNSYDESIVFSKGHRGIPCANHFSLLDHDGIGLPDDAGFSNNTDIYYRTSSENIVTFIWHCETAENYQTGTIPYDANGFYGMPFCWTHNYNLPCWGTSGNQVFLGWVNQSPQYETGAEGIYNYAHVAYYFWYYMCNGDTVEEALDTIADNIFDDDDYLDSPLCDWLVVWGDRTLELP